MGRHCSAIGCSNNSLKQSCKDKGITFHSFPLHDPERLKKWLINLRRKDFVPNTYSYVCSEHFRGDDFFIQMFTKTRLLKKEAVPMKYSEKAEEVHPRSTMIKKAENRMKPSTHQGKNYKSIIGKRELMCNKCGFVTFSLHLLYTHKYKCRGQLLGKPLFCSYCKRKFSFATLYKKHKVTCVRKALRRRFLKSKFAKKRLIHEGKSKQVLSYKFSFSCPICHASFKSKLNFVNHLKQQSCSTQQTKTKKSFSARKSFSSRKSSKVSSIYGKKIHSGVTEHEDSFSDSKTRELHRCLWCKSEYPSEQLLFMHFKMNQECAIAYYKKHCPDVNKKASVKARKTISVKARKSFPQQKYGEKHTTISKANSSRSARKSITSSKKTSNTKFHRSTTGNKLNQCPVCNEDFPDTFAFYQHQKLMNHWGKATKTLSVSCKCPFCDKEFMHVKARNAHVYNHSDRSEKDIKAFIKSCTCNVCYQIFVSETAKFQHMKIEHPDDMKSLPSGSNATSDNEYHDKHKMSSVPSSVKKKLRQQPNSCPVCLKTFSHTVLRNKHFNEAHLKIFECQYCNTKFKSTSSLTNHIQFAHGKNLGCKGCTASFSNELELLQHILKCHPNEDPRLLLPSKPINTPPNEKNQNIVENITVRHSGETSSSSSSRRNIEYYCDVCDIGYQKLCGLQRHRQSKFHKDTLEKSLDAFQKTNSNLPTSSLPVLPKIVKQPEIITCSECSDEFTNIKDFVPHRLSHFSVQGKYLRITELNPYMCEICSDVLDSHSKVQLHLFWHLQVESTSSKDNNIGNSKNDTIVPDRHSGQHVAKKSFSKPNKECMQEVVIGGVAKPLFTCEACNVGFTTKMHYDIHVRKLCKKLKPVKHTSNSERDTNNESSLDAAEAEIVHCRNCNFLFISETIFCQHKQFCTKCLYEKHSEEISVNLEVIKSSLSQHGAVAGCVTCAALFDNVNDVETHIIAHQIYENALSDDATDLLHCALCNSLFSLSAFKEHRSFCKIPVNISRKITKHMDVLKSALELKCSVAACISCGMPFDDLESFSEHLILHQTNQIQNDTVDIRNSYGQTSSDEVKWSAVNFDSEPPSVDNARDFLTGGGDSMNVASDDEEAKLPNKSFDNNETSFASLMAGESKQSTSEQTNKTSNNLKELRENFSQLLCLLISNSELIQKLGFGKLEIDDVLINVLKQMGQKPHADGGSAIDLLRKNIKMLLGLCLKEPFLQTLGKDRLADEIVVEALNIFTSEMTSDSE